MMAYVQLGKRISHEQAAAIIGDHFTDVRDKLLNILQLKQATTEATENQELVLEADVFLASGGATLTKQDDGTIRHLFAL